MSFELHLILRGLCAVVPGGPVPTQPTPSPHRVPNLKVLVLDAKAGAVPGFPVCDHVAQIRAEQPQGADLVVPLAGHSISIGPLPAGAAEVALNSTYWDVAHMNRVYADFKIDPPLLQNPPARPGVVVAHLQLPAGSISGLDFSPQTLSFPSSNYSGNFALSVRIKVPIDAGTGTLTVTPFAGGQATELTLEPKPGKSFVEVTLSNLCAQSDAVGVLQAAQGVQGTQGLREAEDVDFAVYYRLEESLRDPILVPEIVHGNPHPGEVSGTATQAGASCIPTRIGG